MASPQRRIDGDRDAEHRAPWKTVLLAGAPVAVVALGCALRLYHLGASSVWIDEANTVRIVRMDLPDLLGALSQDSSPPLYYLLLHSWMSLLGEGPIAIRLLSVVFGVTLIGYLFVVGRRFLSYRTGLVAALLVAVAPAQILHAQQCRMYTLLPLLALGSWHCLRNAADTGSRTWLAGWVACTTAALYTHNYGWFLFPAFLWVLAFDGELRRRPLRWIGATALIGLAYLPWGPILWRQLQMGAQNAWYEPIWRGLGPTGNLLATLDSFSGGRISLSFTWAGRDTLMLPRQLLLVAAVVWALYTAFRRGGDPGSQRMVREALAFLLAPLITLLVVSVIASPVYRYGRSDQLVFAAFLLLAAAWVTAYRKPAIVAALAASWTVVSLANYPPAAAHASMRDDAGVAGTILSLARPGDAALATSLTAGPLEYYARQAGVHLPVVTFPREDARHPGMQDRTVWRGEPGALETEARAAFDAACGAAGPSGRVFTVLGIEDFNLPLVRLLEGRGPTHLLMLPGDRRVTVANVPVRLAIATCP